MGDIISVGERTNPTLPPNTRTDVYIVVTNAAGGVVSEFTIDILGGDDFAKDFTETSNGNGHIVITGHATKPGTTNADIFLLEFDPSLGTVSWCKLYSGAYITGNFNDEAYDILDVAGNGYVVAGRSNTNHATHYDAILFKTDYSGNWMWGTSFDGPNHADEGFFSVTASLTSQDLVAGGYTTDMGGADVFMAQVGWNGETQAAVRFPAAAVTSNEGVRRVWACDPLGPNTNTVLVVGNTSQGGITSDAMMGTVTLPISAASILNGRTYLFPTSNHWSEAMDGFETPAPEWNFVMTGLVDRPPFGAGSYEFFIGRTWPNLMLNGYNYHGGTSSDQGWHCDMASGIAAGEPYSIVATGLRTTNTLRQQLDITRTTQWLTFDCRVEDFPDQPEFHWDAIDMTQCSHFWGLHLQDLIVNPRRIATETKFCPDAAFNTRERDPAIGEQNSIHSNHPELLQGKNPTTPPVKQPVDAQPIEEKAPGIHFHSNH
jgi:hypothetical protein